MSRFLHPEYVNARVVVAAALAGRIAEMDRLYDVAEGIISSRQIRITRPRGMRHKGAVAIVLSLLAKALKTFRAIRVTALEGCGQDAGTLLRSLFETTTAVLWILQRDSVRRAQLYTAHSDVRQWVMATEQAKTPGLKRIGKGNLRSCQPVLDNWIGRLGKSSVDSVHKHWSGLPGGLEAVSRRLKGWQVAYNSVYRETSHFAHAADPTTHLKPAHFSIGIFPILPGDIECDRVLATAMSLLGTAAHRISDRLGLGFEETLGSLEIQRIKIGKRLTRVANADT